MEWPIKYINISINNNFVAWKHGHVVACPALHMATIFLFIEESINFYVKHGPLFCKNHSTLCVGTKQQQKDHELF